MERWVKENLSSDTLAEIQYYHSNVEDDNRGILAPLHEALMDIVRTNKLPEAEPETNDDTVLRPKAFARWECERIMNGMVLSEDSAEANDWESFLVFEALTAHQLRLLSEVIESPRDAAWFALSYMG